MTIRKGEPWGEPGALPSDGFFVRTDAEARRLVEEAPTGELLARPAHPSSRALVQAARDLRG